MKYPISRYLNVRSAYFPSFTSDGQRIAFIANITGVPQIWQVPLPSDPDGVLWPDQLSFETDRAMGVWCSPAPGDGRLIYARDVGGNENAQLCLLSADGATETFLTAGHEDAMHIFGEWSADGSQILFAANRRDPGLFDLYLQPLDGEARLVWRHGEPGFLIDMRFSPDGRRSVVRRMSSSFRHDLFEVDLIAGIAHRISPSDEDTRYEAVSYAEDGRSLFTTTDLDAEYLHIVRLDLETGSMAKVVASDRDIELMTCSPDGRCIAYAVNLDGASELRLLDLASGETRTAPALDTSPGVVGMMGWRRTSARLIRCA
ncbi:MAG: Dipeptidyl-peptidase 5 [Anaerolineales bacterium]|nr:Dipeptidyl-peptidase 5 [Anaerolineales bacterium]